MSRLRKAFHGVTTGYLLLAVVAVYALGSIPMALHYLTTERFGLWALLGSLIGYLNMIDLGMSSSVGRHLVDVKDNREGGAYGSMIKTGWCVLLTQGVALMAIGVVCAGMFSKWMDIPAHLERTFQIMVWLQCGVTGLGFATKMFSFLLIAHQRMDLTNYGSILSLVVNFFGLWIFFALGFDIYSLVYAGFVATLAGALFQLAWCFKLSLIPHGMGWGSVSGAMFKEMFSYGRDVFLVSLGAQLIMASQTIIITRQLGLEAAAAWSVGTRTFNLLWQSLSRVSFSTLSGISEMLARNEWHRLRDRYTSLVILVTSLSVYCAVTFAMCNSVFVSVWTSGKSYWSVQNDVFLAMWMVVLAVSNANGSFVLVTKKVHFMKYVYFLEGIVFILLAFVVVKRFGISGLILCSVICSICFSGAYTAWRVSRFLGLSFQVVTVRWSRNAAFVLVALGPVAVATWCLTQNLYPRVQLLANISVGIFIGLPLLLRLGIPEQLKLEFLAHAPKRFISFFGVVLGCRRIGA